VGCQRSGPEGGGIHVVKACFDVWEEGGDFQSGSLEGRYLLGEGKARVGGAEAWERAALLWVEKTIGPDDGGQPDCHHPFENL